ncbi:glycosyltransferase family 2 protein [Candidatus Woesebacteria bacterium]|nr:glycosyltransferase family 2 protein [Candidatus Woesebacteria bacterium]
MANKKISKMIKEISVFFPFYNEEANIKKTVMKAKKVLEKVASKWEILMINDGSSDDTLKIARQLAKSDKRLKVVNHKTNKGYGEALKSGFYNAKYTWVTTVDGDGQFDFSEITKLWKKTERADIVIGYRIERQDPFVRKVFGRGWTMLANILLGINVRDVDCAFKLVKREVIENISHLESTRGGMISPELLAKAKKQGYIIKQVGVHHYPRDVGHQTGADIKVIYKSFKDLLKLWQQLR